MRGQLYIQALAFLAIGASLVGATGCVSYTNVSGPESPPSFRSPNHFAAVDVTGKALDWVVTRHGPGEGAGYVVNLPAGTTQENAMKIFARMPSGATWPATIEQDGLGMYHISRVWIRSSEAKVDVVYPFAMLNGGTGQRGVTVWLQGGVRKWRVIRGQYWAPGTVAVPAVAVPWNEIGDAPALNEPVAPRGSLQEEQEEIVVPDVQAPVVEPVEHIIPVREVDGDVDSPATSEQHWREVPVGGQ
ncbi:MAG: hypothetical protein JKY96_03025 [Phycisphaerales bacterium]|nr:hypothetical protein [Phycisphaerales bacterium]